MFFHQRFVPGLAIVSYMIGDERTREIAVIDPTRDVDEFIAIARAEGMMIAHILETHVHADFVSGARELKARLGGTPVIHCSGMGGPEWTPTYADRVANDGDEIRMGGLRIVAMHTPGHTPEHMSWALFDDTRSKTTPWLLFSGDFVFVGDVGRPDLLGDAERVKLAHQLYDSLFKVLPRLPDFTEVFPAHGAGSLCGKAIGSRRSSSLGYERQFNASMKQMPEKEWTDRLMAGMPPAPPYFRRMKRVNREGPPLLGDELPGRRPIPPRELHDSLLDRVTVLDVRREAAFVEAHIKGSVAIPLGPQLPTWAGWVLPEDRPIVIVAANSTDAEEACRHLIRIGFDRIEGHVDGGIDAWKQAGYPVEHLATMSTADLERRLQDGPKSRPLVLDVRSEGEWKSGHIEGSVNIHAGVVGQRAGELPQDREIAVICGSGYRSIIAASLLRQHNLERVTSVSGGMTAWNAVRGIEGGSCSSQSRVAAPFACGGTTASADNT